MTTDDTKATEKDEKVSLSEWEQQQKRLADLEAELRAAKESRANWHDAASEACGRADAAEAKLATVTRERDEAKSLVCSMSDERRDLEVQIDSLTRELAEAKRGDPDGHLLAVYQVLRASPDAVAGELFEAGEPRYERVVRAAKERMGELAEAKAALDFARDCLEAERRNVGTLSGALTEQKQTSGRWALEMPPKATRWGSPTDTGSSTSPQPAVPELSTTKGGDAMQPMPSVIESAGGREGTDSPPYETAPRLSKGDEVRLRNAPAHVGSDVVVRVSTYDGLRVLLRDTGWRWVKDVVRVEPEKAQLPKCQCGSTLTDGMRCFMCGDEFIEPHDGGGERRNCISDEGPPRVGDVVADHARTWERTVKRVYDSGECFQLDNDEGWYAEELVIIRRAGQPEKCESCGGRCGAADWAAQRQCCPDCTCTEEKAMVDG